MDKIIKHVNADGRVNAFYSSPEIYTQAKLAEAKSGQVQWPLVEGNNADFFPYADGPHQFWTGYFTSRPAAKRYVREQSAFHNAVRQMQSLAGKDLAGVDALLRFEEALGVHQHHDAISGTAKQHVAFDYAKRVARGQTDGEALMAQTLSVLSQVPSGTSWSTCRRLNETVCATTQNLPRASSVAVAVWNQLGQARTELIRLPVASPDVIVTDAASGQQVAVQVTAVDETVSNYARHTQEADYAVSFVADLPAVGFNMYHVEMSATTAAASLAPTLMVPSADVVLENENLQLVFSSATGRLQSMKNKVSGVQTTVDQYFCTYIGNTGDDKSPQRSGAYIFRPRDNVCTPVATGAVKLTSVVTGAVVQEVTQVFGDWVTQTVRLVAGARHAEFHYTVGPVDIGGPNTDVQGREVISKFVTSIASAGALLTDSNGREMLHRQRDYRPYWNLSQTEPVAGNYFPINSAAAIADGVSQLTVLVDAAQVIYLTPCFKFNLI